MQFKDHFSSHSPDYAKYRPRYPAALFEYLASMTPEHERAWDCATGNGQAALSLAPFFAQVIATDASQSQLDSAPPHEKISYRVAAAEQTDIEAASVNLVTVAQALHWFDLEAFYREVKRVLKPAGVLAVWAYNLLEIEPSIDAKVNEFYGLTVGPYWPPERRLIEDGYRSIVFPFEELKPPPVRMEASWRLSDLVGYLQTWSATKRFIAARGFDPVPALANELLPVWGATNEEKRVYWPLSLRVGVVPRMNGSR
ncbi:MAG TPA: class I SAM-dependent methyltransferase [Pyrinomonadaceae bacterium]|jgi:SAM-dependent methyltransferase|nr:class I SAM-dependent methyltransferase [Pyrinomonadaceae bacterium]